MGVLYLDIDKFKSINDTLGHASGDPLLKAFAERIRQTVRAADTVARLGGDEFVVLLETLADGTHAAQVAEKIIFAMQPVFELGTERLQVTTSVGVAIYSGTTLQPAPGDFVGRADHALYAAKRAGRNNFKIADEI